MPLKGKSSLLKSGSNFSTPEVYFAGSYEGCGCAFNYGREYPSLEADQEEIETAEKSVKEMVEYISSNQVTEIFACWMGDEEKKPNSFREISTEQIGAKDFFFKEQELLKVKYGL